MNIKFLGDQKGQTLLIIVLVMVVALTAGISIVTRTLTNLRTSTEQANSQKALSAAEAGIEQSLKNIQSGTNTPAIGGFGTGSTASTYTSTITQIQSQTFLMAGGAKLDKDDGAYVWLLPYEQDFNAPYWNGTLNFYWGQSSDTCSQDPTANTQAALEIIVIAGGNKNAPVLKRYTVDPCPPRKGINNFSNPDASPGPPYSKAGQTFQNRTSVTIANSGMLVRVIPLYAPAMVAVEAATGSPALPTQGTVVTSTGQSDKTVRKVVVFQGYPELPLELFPYSLFQPK